MNRILKNPVFLAALSAGLLRLSFPKFDCWPLALVAFVPLLKALEGRRPAQALGISFLAGFFFFVTTIFWLIHVTIPGMLVLSGYLALYFAVFGLGVASLKKRIGFGLYVVFVPAFWVLLEFTRSTLLTGFPWALLAYSQSSNIVGIQAADVVGAFGISFAVMLSNIFVYEIARRKSEGIRVARPQIFVPLLVLLLWIGYGVFRAEQDPRRDGTLKISVIQGNISQEIKWAPQFRSKIFDEYRLLTEIAALKEDPDLIVWPETAFPDPVELGEDDAPLKGLTAATGVPLLAGAIRLEGSRYANSAMLFLPTGEMGGVYDKIHLVPFGEYIPFRRPLPFMAHVVPIEDFTPGKKFTIFSRPGRGSAVMSFGVLICFEDIFATLAREFVKRGADFLVNMTNDAWFGDTASPYQHLEASVFRAVENRLYVLRAANTGISCFIDDAGRVFKIVKDRTGKATFVAGSETGRVYRTGRRSLYTQIGDIFAILCVLTAGAVILLSPKGSRR